MSENQQVNRTVGARLRAIIFLVLKAGITVAAFTWVFHQIDAAGLVNKFTSVNPTWLFVGCVALLLHFTIMVWRWSYVLRKICAVNVSYRQLTFVFGLGEIIGTFFPSFIGTDVIRTLAMSSTAPVAKILDSVVIDRTLGLVALLILIALCLPAFALSFGIGQIFILLCFLSLGGLATYFSLVRWPSILSRLPLVGIRLVPILRHLYAASTNRHLSSVILGSGLLMHVLALSIIWAAVNMLGFSLKFSDCLLIVPGALLIAALPISLGGWGLREGALVAGFGLVGADPATIVAASIAYGFSGMLSGAVGIGVSAVFRRKASSDMSFAEKDLREEYEASAENWDSTFNAEAINRIHVATCWRAFRKVLGKEYGTSKAVELGVGTGLFTDLMAAEFHELTAVDFSQRMLDQLAVKLASRDIANVVFFNADAMNLESLPESSADVVYCFGLLENIPDVERLFLEVARILKPRGRFAGVVSNRSCPWYKVRKLILGKRWYWEGVRLMSASELRQTAHAAKLTERRIVGWGLVPSQVPNSSLLMPISLFERVLEATPLSRFLGGLAFCFERR